MNEHTVQELFTSCTATQISQCLKLFKNVKTECTLRLTHTDVCELEMIKQGLWVGALTHDIHIGLYNHSLYTTMWYAIHMLPPSQTHLQGLLVLAEEGWGMRGWVAQRLV